MISSCQSSYKQVTIILKQICHGQTNQTKSIIIIMNAVYFQLCATW